MVFNTIKEVILPEKVYAEEGFTLTIVADGEIPFPQLILRQKDGRQEIIKDQQVACLKNNQYRFAIPADCFSQGTIYLQIEGCRKKDISLAEADDWIKKYCEIEAKSPRQPITQPEKYAKQKPITDSQPSDHLDSAGKPPSPPPKDQVVSAEVRVGKSNEPCLYFAIHKHMHQPYYNAVDSAYWDGEKDEIFSSRGGPYTDFIPHAINQYAEGQLAHAGLSTSWSGSLIEQLNRCADQGYCGGRFTHWKQNLANAAREKTSLGNPRLDFTAFGFFHPLMPLIPKRDIVGQIEWHRQIIRDTFGVEASDILFPPETAFHPHLIPALKAAGIKAVIYDSIHHFRACKDYPYAGTGEGMLPPNEAEQENFPVTDWLQLNNIWAGSKISPSLLKPCILAYADNEGVRQQIIGIPAERYLGNEDARGGYGALQYEDVMGQILANISASGNFEPEHPPFFVLHSDGDNYGGGAESYYTSNTARLVQMCRQDQRFQLSTITDYLTRFPVDQANIVHLEPGSWAGADNGDPQFSKWFSQADADYSPDLNSWAILTAFQNLVHSLEDYGAEQNLINELKRLLYTAETSCYWYWTGQEIWDKQVTEAANAGFKKAKKILRNILENNADKTAPTIFVPWIRPANPGGKDWGNNCLIDAKQEATLRTLIFDISDLAEVKLFYHQVGGSSTEVTMQESGAYPSQTNPQITAKLYQTTLAPGSGNIRYTVEATDKCGNYSCSPVGRIFIA